MTTTAGAIAVRVSKPAVLSELSLAHHAIIEASAGTGKTYTLEHLVIDLLITARAELSELLVVTFTDKAARELKTRVRGTIRRILTTPPAGAHPQDGPAWTIDEAARARLNRALVSFDTAHISTIHAFCRRVLTDHAFENRRMFMESIVDGRQAFRRAFLEVLRTRFARAPECVPYLDAWLDHGDLDGLVELLFETHRQRGRFWPEHDEAKLTETVRALSRLELEPGVLRPQLAGVGLPAATQKAIIGRTLKLRRLLAAYRDQPGAFLGALEIAETQPGGLVDYVVDRLGPAVDERGVLFEYVQALRSLEKSTPPFRSVVAQRFLPDVREALARSKAARGELDFDDMLDLVRDGLEGPDGESLSRSLKARFRFVLIDEFQDTDPVQWRVFERAFLDGDGAHRLFVIGDPKQSIYGFRGADVHTYLAARRHLLRRGGRSVHLTESFRAGPALVEALNRIFDQKRRSPFFSGSIRYEAPVRSGRPRLGGLVVRGANRSPVHVFRLVSTGDPMTSSDRRRTLAHRIATEIRFLLESRAGWRTEERLAPLSAQDIFVLTRTGREGREVARHLRQSGLQNAFYRQEGLFQTPEADDVRWLLAAVANPGVSARRLRAFMGPFFSVPLADAPRTLDLAADHPLLRQLHDWKRLADARDYERLFFTILDESGLVRRQLLLHESERELTNYLHIFEVLEALVARARVPLPDLIHTLSGWIDRRGLPPGEDGNIERLESERDAVQIMTMHKAKGLEAPVVFLFGGFDEPETQSHVFHDRRGRRRVFVGPRLPPEVQKERREEDERLVYVALTRAQARLYVPYLGPCPSAPSGPAEADRGAPEIAGSHRVLEDALRAVLETGAAGGPAGFEVEDCPEVPYDPTPDLPSETAERLRQWVIPPPAGASGPRRSPDLDALREARRGPPITSYSRLKAEDRAAMNGGSPEAADDVVAETRTVADDGTRSGGLPPGAATGRLLHELLETVEFETLRAAEGAEGWSAHPDVERAGVEGLARHDLPATALPEALRLVYTALTVPLQLGAVRLPGGLGQASRIVRELEFLYPAPDAAGRERALVKGFIDVVFEHDGRVYLLDWKSDVLPDYAPAALDAHVKDHYLLQAELYTLALVRLFRLRNAADYRRRFGGAAYAFLRGLDPAEPSRGQWFWRPSFAEVEAITPRLAERFHDFDDFDGSRSA